MQQFQKVFKSVMIQLGLMPFDSLGVSRQSIDFSMNSMVRSISKDKSHNKGNAMTFLASIVMNINDQNITKNNGQPLDLYSNIAAKPELKISAEEFN